MGHPEQGTDHRQRLQRPQAFAIEQATNQYHRQGQQEVAEGNLQHPPGQGRPDEQRPLHAHQGRRQGQGRQQARLAAQALRHGAQHAPLPREQHQQQHHRDRPEHALGKHLRTVQRRQLAHITGNQHKQHRRNQRQADATSGQLHTRLTWARLIHTRKT